MTNLTGFAEACYNTNSVAELEDAIMASQADQTDCNTWGVTSLEWFQVIQEVLAERLADTI